MSKKAKTGIGVEVPEDLTGLSVEELNEIEAEITDWSQEAAASDDLTPELVEAMERAAADIARVREARDEAETVLADREARKAAAIAAISGTPVASDEGDGDAGDGDEASDEGDGDAAPVEGDDGDAAGDETPEGALPIAAASKGARYSGPVTRMSERKNPRKTARPTLGGNVERPKLRATHEAVRAGAKLNEVIDDPDKFAHFVTRTMDKQRKVSQRDKITLGTAQFSWPEDRTLREKDLAHNSRVMRNIQSFQRQAAILASGACLAPLPATYELMGYATPQSPVEQHLPTLGVPRLGMQWWPPLDWRQGKSGIATFTMDELTDQVEVIDKPAVRITCPSDPESDYVEALTFVVEMGNETQKAFPELVARFLDDMRTYYASYKEIAYMNAIDAACTDVTQTGSDQPYGFTTTALHTLSLAARGYRKRHNLPRNTRLEVYMSDDTLDHFAEDLLAHGFVSDPAAALLTDSDIASIMGRLNLDVVWTNDQATGDPTNLFQPQTAGALIRPADYSWYKMCLPGSFIRMDGGSLDAGVQRSPELNRSNDIQIFMEEWTKVVFVGLEAIAGHIPVKAPGVRSANVTADVDALVTSSVVTTLP